jgi:hypothetical protein
MVALISNFVRFWLQFTRKNRHWFKPTWFKPNNSGLAPHTFPIEEYFNTYPIPNNMGLALDEVLEGNWGF